jgi:hypothetical protein
MGGAIGAIAGGAVKGLAGAAVESLAGGDKKAEESKKAEGSKGAKGGLPPSPMELIKNVISQSL